NRSRAQQHRELRADLSANLAAERLWSGRAPGDLRQGRKRAQAVNAWCGQVSRECETVPPGEGRTSVRCGPAFAAGLFIAALPACRRILAGARAGLRLS